MNYKDLDQIDDKILLNLFHTARRAKELTTSVSKEYNITNSAIYARLKKLADDGFISKTKTSRRCSIYNLTERGSDYVEDGTGELFGMINIIKNSPDPLDFVAELQTNIIIGDLSDETRNKIDGEKRSIIKKYAYNSFQNLKEYLVSEVVNLDEFKKELNNGT